MTDNGTQRRGRPGYDQEGILRVAVAAFNQYGYDATSMGVLADRLGLSKSAIYNHFASKEKLLAAATSWGVDDFQQSVLAIDDDTMPLIDRLHGLVDRHVRYQLEHIEMARSNDLLIDEVTLQDLLPADLADGLRSRLIRHLDLLTELIEEFWSNDRPGDARTAATGVLSMCDRVTAWHGTANGPSIDGVANTYWHMVESMLQPAQRSSSCNCSESP